MNATLETNGRASRLSNFLRGLLVAGLLLGASACATNRQQTIGGAEPSGFLVDYSQMQAGLADRANLYYEKPDVNWSQYTQVWIKPVELWTANDPDSPMGKLSQDDQQNLIDLAYTDLNNSLSKDYTIVDHGGPGILIIHAAITDTKKSKPVIGAVANIWLPTKVISLGKQSLTGTGIGVGSITIEAELLDGDTNERLVAVVDSRSGTTAIRSKFDGTWGDIEQSLQWWSDRLQTRLAEERANSPTKTPL
jgi:Protein of unknown function (DUF3313)